MLNSIEILKMPFVLMKTSNNLLKLMS